MTDPTPLGAAADTQRYLDLKKQLREAQAENRQLAHDLRVAKADRQMTLNRYKQLQEALAPVFDIAAPGSPWIKEHNDWLRDQWDHERELYD